MTLQEIQERYFEITDDWAAEDPKQQWTSVAELDDMLHELEDVDQPDTPAVQKLRERIEALMDEIENHLDVQLVEHVVDFLHLLDLHLGIEDYLRIIEMKTGSLFAAAAELGASNIHVRLLRRPFQLWRAVIVALHNGGT